MGMWYKRNEAQKRFSFFFSSTTLAGAFGGLLASAIGKMDGLQGYRGWRWIFILEGLLTCLVAFAWFFLIPDFPEDVKWLNEEERTFVRAKLAKDSGGAGHHVSMTWRDVLDVLKDCEFCLSAPLLPYRTTALDEELTVPLVKVFVGGLMYFGMIVPAYGYAYFAPTIIKTYGYSRKFHISVNGLFKSTLTSYPPTTSNQNPALLHPTLGRRILLLYDARLDLRPRQAPLPLRLLAYLHGHGRLRHRPQRPRH